MWVIVDQLSCAKNKNNNSQRNSFSIINGKHCKINQVKRNLMKQAPRKTAENNEITVTSGERTREL